ncbi:MAG: hypothetical protein NC222_06785 [Staphylococcus sp.]|nr:hypothetical protein [Staphylococcus sp.]
MNNSVFFKISRNQMNRALTVLNNAYNKLNKEEPDPLKVESKVYYNFLDKKEKLKYYLEVTNFSIKQTKLKSFYVDYDFAKLIKSILFIEEKEAKQ